MTGGEERPSGTPPGSSAADGGALVGREAWISGLRDALLALASADPPPRDLLLWSADFAEWPLDEAPVLDALSQWLRPNGRRLCLIGRDFEATARRHPRLVRWRRDWSHRIDTWTPTVPLDGEPAGLLLSSALLVQLLDPVHWRARRVADAGAVRLWREQCDASLQRCEPAWPATTLGL